MKKSLTLILVFTGTAIISCNQQQEVTGTAADTTAVDAVSAETSTYRGYAIKEEEAGEQAYIMKKAEMSFDAITPFYAENFPKIFEAAGKQNLKITGSPSGLFFTFDEASKRAETAAAVPVEGNQATMVKGYETFVAPAGKMLVIDYYGAYDKSAEAHYAMDDYMKEKSLVTNGPMIEEYITDPSTEPDTSKWLTRIYYRVK